MAKLSWHEQEKRRYEYGVDRGVFYSPVGENRYDYGVVWNGLVSVDENFDGGDVSSYHFDGVKYLDTISPRNYKAALSAYSAPQKFIESLGNKPIVPGFILTRQARTLFGLSYRTFVGPDLGYKIHLVYNLLATQESLSHSTVSDSPTAEVLSWNLDAVPPVGLRYRPSAHFILDSFKMGPDLTETIELIIHGTDKTTARLPTIEELIGLVGLWHPLLIVPQSATGLADLVDGVGDLYSTSTEGFYQAMPQTRLNPTPIEGIYRLE